MLRPLDHYTAAWELRWDEQKAEFAKEAGTYAAALNALIDEIDASVAPSKYHDNEDRLAEYVRDHLGWPIRRKGRRWVANDGSEIDYVRLLELGGWRSANVNELMLASAGRIDAAVSRGQHHFDDMEAAHQKMLAAVLTVILYHRSGSLEW